jgi:hypothetical protein
MVWVPWAIRLSVTEANGQQVLYAPLVSLWHERLAPDVQLFLPMLQIPAYACLRHSDFRLLFANPLPDAVLGVQVLPGSLLVESVKVKDNDQVQNWPTSGRGEDLKFFRTNRLLQEARGEKVNPTTAFKSASRELLVRVFGREFR